MKHLLFFIVPALCGMAMTMQAAQSACDGSNRVSHSSSHCLHAISLDDSNNRLLSSQWELTNRCEGYTNTLKFKVVVVRGNDIDYRVASGDIVTGSTHGDINGAFCCRDNAPSIDDTNFCDVGSTTDWLKLIIAQCDTDGINPNDSNCPEDLVTAVGGQYMYNRLTSQ